MLLHRVRRPHRHPRLQGRLQHPLSTMDRRFVRHRDAGHLDHHRHDHRETVLGTEEVAHASWTGRWRQYRDTIWRHHIGDGRERAGLFGDDGRVSDFVAYGECEFLCHALWLPPQD